MSTTIHLDLWVVLLGCLIGALWAGAGIIMFWWISRQNQTIEELSDNLDSAIGAIEGMTYHADDVDDNDNDDDGFQDHETRPLIPVDSKKLR